MRLDGFPTLSIHEDAIVLSIDDHIFVVQYAKAGENNFGPVPRGHHGVEKSTDRVGRWFTHGRKTPIPWGDATIGITKP
jgi:hypothetical protein